jgi:transcriptional regulator with XRE-family HTH domain
MKKDLKTEFGKLLKTYRTEQGFSQEELSIVADVERVYISRLELGKNNPTLETTFKILDALEVNPVDFVTKLTEKTGKRKKKK